MAEDLEDVVRRKLSAALERWVHKVSVGRPVKADMDAIYILVEISDILPFLKSDEFDEVRDLVMRIQE